MAETALADRYDALLLDLDGTVVLAGKPIPHAAEVLQRLHNSGPRTMVVTNNASRSPETVSAHLAELGIAIDPADVISSPLAAARMLAQAHHRGDPVLVVGAQALADAVSATGLTPVRRAADHPVAVVQGHDPDTCWHDLAEACIALRAGADWVATNTDVTLPTDRGLLPGNGALVQALVTATGLHPRVAGKPARPLLDAAVERAAAQRPLVVGDRLETDIAAAVAAGLPSLMVLTGVSTPTELLAAPAERRPTAVAVDLRGLVDSTMVAMLDDSDGHERRDGWDITVSGGRLELRSEAGGTPISALGALAVQAWATGMTDVRAGDDEAAAALTELGLSAGSGGR
jgi:HAD superfamily hydrolase (TIGR01450 family)